MALDRAWQRERLEMDRVEGEAIADLKAKAVQPYPDTVPPELQGKVLIGPVDSIFNWGRRSSVWPLSFGLACCAIEFMACGFSRFDLGRFGMDIARASPRQADVMIVAGTVTWKMAPAVRRLYDQMAEPKWVVAMGACATCGGTFHDSYSVVPGVNRIVPVDVYIPGCPPRPDALLYGLMKLHERIDKGIVARKDGR